MCHQCLYDLKGSFKESRDKVSLKPFATRHTLYLSTLPFDSLLVLNLQLQPIAFGPSGNRTRSYTSLSFVDFILSFNSSEVKTLHGLTKIDWIIFYHSKCPPHVLGEIQYSHLVLTFPFYSGSP